MKCEQCGEELEGTVRARYCNATCRSKTFRNANATQSESSVAKSEISVAKEPKIIPIERWTKRPAPSKVSSVHGSSTKVEKSETNYYKSKEYLDLVKHLEETPLSELKKEGIYIPAWKYSGHKKKPNIEEMLK